MFFSYEKGIIQLCALEIWSDKPLSMHNETSNTNHNKHHFILTFVDLRHFKNNIRIKMNSIPKECLHIQEFLIVYLYSTFIQNTSQ